MLLVRGTSVEADRFLQSGWFDRILVGSTNDDELNQVTTFATATQPLQMIPTKGQGLYHGFSSSAQLDVRWLRLDMLIGNPSHHCSPTMIKRSNNYS